MKYGPELSEQEVFKIGRAIFRCEKKWLGVYRITCEKLDKDGYFWRIGKARYGDIDIRSVLYRYIGAA